MKGKSGITLVALIVTIIVLLILAGVSIAAVIGEDGIIGEANQAKNDSNKAGWIEEISAEVLRKQTSLSGDMTSDELADVLEKYGTLSSRNEILKQTLTLDDGTVIKVTEVFTGTLAGYDSLATADVKIDAEVIVEETSGDNAIKVDVTVSNYTGTLDEEELYYNYFIKSSTDEEYTLKESGQNLTSLTMILTKSDTYTVMVQISEDIGRSSVVGMGKVDGIVFEATAVPVYTVTFYAEDKSTVLQTVTVEEGNTATYTGTTPTKSGYTFQYWVEDGETLEFDLGNVTADTKLYPYFITSGVCFVEGTKVLTENGLVNIEDVQIGMKVLSYNEELKEVEIKEVKNTFINYVSYNMCKVTVGGVTIESTDGHEYYVVGKGWTDACELKVGDILLNCNNEKMIVENVEVIKSTGLTTVYNFEVEDNHNYYVGENSVLVHNVAPSIGNHGCDGGHI